jgi:hypothetical protein
MPEVTYERLNQILQSLGFSLPVDEKGTRVYRHEGTGALIIMPARKDHDLVPPHHVVGTRMILEAYGIMDPPEFTSRLQKAG